MRGSCANRHANTSLCCGAWFPTRHRHSVGNALSLHPTVVSGTSVRPDEVNACVGRARLSQISSAHCPGELCPIQTVRSLQARAPPFAPILVSTTFATACKAPCHGWRPTAQHAVIIGVDARWFHGDSAVGQGSAAGRRDTVSTTIPQRLFLGRGAACTRDHGAIQFAAGARVSAVALCGASYSSWKWTRKRGIPHSAAAPVRQVLTSWVVARGVPTSSCAVDGRVSTTSREPLRTRRIALSAERRCQPPASYLSAWRAGGRPLWRRFSSRRSRSGD